jgi:hypothetical protein
VTVVVLIPAADFGVSRLIWRSTDAKSVTISAAASMLEATRGHAAVSTA